MTRKPNVACAFPDCACTTWCRHSAMGMHQAVVAICRFPSCGCIEQCSSVTVDGQPIQFRGGCPANDEINAPLGDELAFRVGTPCAYCAEPMTDIEGPNHPDARHPTHDHIDPRSRGGSNWPRNLLVACYRCNHEKGSMTLQEWHALLQSSGDDRARHVAWVLAERCMVTEDA